MLAPNPLLQQLIESTIPVYPSVTGLHQPVTAKSLALFLYALGWAWILLIACTGWGRFTGKLVRVRSLPASVACSLGIAVFLFLGGLLNLMHGINSFVIFSLVAIGLLFYLYLRKERPEQYRWKGFWTQASPTARMLLITALLILIFRVAGTVRLAQFNVSDDSAAYLALPQKMLATHHFAADSFSERRNTSSLGGSYFLQNLVLSATSLPHVAMADRTLGLILTAGVVLDLGIALELSVFQISLLELLVFLVPQETFNLTFIILPVSLLLGIVWLISRAVDECIENPISYVFLAGAMGGATILLKSTYLPVVAALSIIPYLLLLALKKPKFALQLSFIAGLGVLAVLICWMIAMKLTSGTYLFPILGRGLDYSRYGLFHVGSRFPSERSLGKIFLQGFVLLIFAYIQLLSKPRTKQSRLCSAVLISCALSIIAINYETSADSIWRYNFPQFFTAVIVFYAASAAIVRYRQSRLSRLAFYLGIASMLSMIFYYDIAGRKPEPFHEIASEIMNQQPLVSGLSDRALTGPILRAEYRNVEAAIPQGDGVLEHVAYSFLFNYRSHDIRIMDWAGASAPLPGWPFRQDSSHIRKYLAQNSIRYVIFDYRYALQNDAGMCQDLTGPNRFSQWLRQQLWMNILVDDQLNQMMLRYRSIYNDGNIAVIDLTKPVPDHPIEEQIVTIDTDVDTVCSVIAYRYFAVHPMLLDVVGQR